MKSSKVQINRLLLLASVMLALMPLSAFADDKDDLYAKGQGFMTAGKAVEARDAFCALAKKDNEYKDAQKQCDDNKKQAERVINLHNQRYADAWKMIDDGKYDDAEKTLKMVKYGDWVQAAQKKLADVAKLKQAKLDADAQNKNAADQANALNVRFELGSAAWNSGNFDGAKAALTGLTGPHAAEAQDIVAKINRYESLITQAGNYAQNKNYAAAMNAYNSAGAINSKGPGNPFSKADDMNNQLALASAPANNPPPTTTAPATNKNALAAADKDKIEKVDEGKLVQDAKQLIAKGKYPQARKVLNKVLAQNLKNKAAQDLMNSLPQEAPQPTTTATVTQEDPVLAAAIREFYKGNYDDAETALGYYLAQGSKKGLGNFYIGVSLLTRYYLSGETDLSLRLKAIRRFSAAKDIAGFKAPEKYISPKILAIYQEAKGPTTATP